MPVKNIFLVTLLLFYFTITQAAKADTVLIYSNHMNAFFKCVVITPTTYKKKKLVFPVVYLLHGFSGDYSNWIKKVPELKRYSDQYQLILVCPDGAYASWYFDSPIDTKMWYETYIGVEVPHYIDSTYRTMADKFHRAITGLSMGGHGALLIAWRHSETFSAAGSMSGGVDLKESVHRFEIEKVLGDTLQHPENWYNNSMINIVLNKPANPLSLIIDCGIDDIFILGNRKLHQELLNLKLPHEYIERPGNHSWDYWKYSIQFQLLFFRKLFDLK